MKRLLVVGFCGFTVFASQIPHLDIDMGGSEYEPFLAQHIFQTGSSQTLQPVLAMGKTFLDWLNLINQSRNSSDLISLTTPTSAGTYTIDNPSYLNEQTVLADFNNLKTNSPAWLRHVLFEGAKATPTLPTSVEEFIEWGVKVDRNYANASRWLLLEPHLKDLAAREKDDVRGYYSLGREADLQNKLSQFEKLSTAEQAKLENWLLGLCRNAYSTEGCKARIASDKKKPGELWRLYQIILPAGKQHWDSYFRIRVPRYDVSWSSAAPDCMGIPFQEPGNQTLHDFLSTNLQDEWAWGGWSLKLFFQNSYGIPHLDFVAGSTPHVDKVGGNKIIMDANAPINQWSVQWIIRHEFGHVLGFPDCYLEFYDTTQQKIVNYQLDITNLMCSRRGRFQLTHYDELKRIYYR